ncbi:hypothetical protein LguiB_025165 [Lonicera macranthoides]
MGTLVDNNASVREKGEKGKGDRSAENCGYENLGKKNYLLEMENRNKKLNKIISSQNFSYQ